MRYSIIKQIGEEGGFGKVYLCEDESNNSYALKMLKNKDDFSIRRFEREVRLMSRLNHPNIMKIISYNLVEEDKFYVMPLYKCSLTKIIPSLEGDYSRQNIIIDSILTAIQYLHSEGVLHRDLKPGNILYNNDKDIAITDFGLGIQIDSSSTQLTKMTVFGSDRYCSPEQGYNSHDVDERTDIYAVGKIIEDIVSNFGKIRTYDNSFNFIIDKCTKRNKEERFTSISEVRRFVAYVYNTIMGVTESKQIDESLLQLANKKLAKEEIVNLAIQIQTSKDSVIIEKFFENIDENFYSIFEQNNSDLAKSLIVKLCSYWNQAGWPFSYIDDIAKIANKIFMVSKNAEIRAELLYILMDLSIYYNRWFAMGVATNLLDEIKKDTASQTVLALKLKNAPLSLDRIVADTDDLPTMILSVYKETKSDEI